MTKSKIVTLSIIALVICSLTFTSDIQVKAAQGPLTTYYLGFLSNSFNIATTNTLVVIAKDANNNTVSSSGTVSLTCSDPKAILPTNTNLAINDGGFGSCSFYFGTAGAQTLTVTDTANNAITGSVTVTVAPIHFNLAVTPTTITVGSSVNVTVTALDASDNVLVDLGNMGYGASIDFTSTDTQAVFPLQGSPSNLINGVRVFNITLQTIGSQTITVINKGFTNVNATTSAITVNPVPTPTPTTTATTSPTPTANPSASPTTPTNSPSSSPSSTTPTDENQPLTTDPQSQTLLIVVALVIIIVVVISVLLLLKKKGKL